MEVPERSGVVGPRWRQERERAVADHALWVADRVGGGGQVQQSHVEPVPSRPVHETTESETPTRVVRTDRGSIPVHNCLGRMPIASLSTHLSEVVGQVRADHRQRVALDAQRVQHIGNLLRCRHADHERDARPSVDQHPLQKRQLNLDRVLRQMRAVVHSDALVSLGESGARVNLHG
jgi:hypothetical protein